MHKEEKKQFIENQIISLRKINELQKQLNDIDDSLAKLYPVAIVKDDVFFIFDLDSTGEKYEFKLEYPTPMHFGKKILAAFPLEFYNMKASAIVTEDVFDSLEGYAFIFHEFVHCFQWETSESEIRKILEIEKKSKESNNFMWEITHPFPYENSIFIQKTIELRNYLNLRDYLSVSNYYKEIKECLKEIDYEYMIWQEWKEGFARYIENLVRHRLGISKHSDNLRPSFDRVCFYEIGSKYIDLLIEKDKSLKYNLKELYFRMFNPI
ncbi:hypothetical protein [Clostridium sp.]|uniref:hypothetical protein n=1 Tax=Clostridium sp. TaxID=1506 RepID=UPI002FC60B6B